jgi:hypothetical protein
MRPTIRVCRLVFGLLTAFGFIASVARAADITIPAGTDFFYRQPGTLYNSPMGPVPLFGIPVFPGGTDTVVDRLADADATTGAR